MDDRFKMPARVVYVWQWRCDPANRWEDYPSVWPSEQWARRHHPSAYNHVPEDHDLRLVKRTISDVEVPQ